MYRMFVVMDEEIKAERKCIINDAIEQDLLLSCKTLLNDKFEKYLNIVKMLDSEEKGWMGLLFYHGFVGKWEKNDKAVKAAACIDILQLNFVLHTYMMHCPNLNKVDRIVQVVNKYLPCKKELIESDEDDSIIRGILACICDYILIIVNRYLDANQEFRNIHQNISQWFMETQVRLYHNFMNFFYNIGGDTADTDSQAVDGKSSYYLGICCREDDKPLNIPDAEDKVLKELEYNFLCKIAGCDIQISDRIKAISEKEIRDIFESIDISIGGARDEKRNRRGRKTS